jgi:hypothetical protein
LRIENATALRDPTFDQEDESEAKRARTNRQTSKVSSNVQEVPATKAEGWIY